MTVVTSSSVLTLNILLWFRNLKEAHVYVNLEHYLAAYISTDPAVGL